jgi:hypothetical protein
MAMENLPSPTSADSVPKRGRPFGAGIERSLDAFVLATLIFLAVHATSVFERWALLGAVLLLLLSWLVAWHRKR